MKKSSHVNAPNPAPESAALRATVDGDDREPRGDLQLVVMDHGSLSRCPLPKRGVLRIGRAETCDIVLTDPAASRLHALLHVAGQTLELVDVGSHNGTRIQDQRLTAEQRVALRVGDSVQIGGAILCLQRHFERSGAGATSNQQAANGVPLVIRSPAMRAIFELVDRVAGSNINVLILGETGSGKEVIAERIHRASGRRSQGPFVRINCAALGEALFESELFGYQQGAFTGAVRSKAGLMQTADKGTLFLDEIGEVPLAAQAKLLRVIETREATPLGGLRPQLLDVRFVCATNRNLKSEVAKGTFREDLYFRLKGVIVAVPPLRERASEIDELADSFLSAIAHELGRSSLRLSTAARQRLRDHLWPGNIRELKNAVECAALLTHDSLIEVEHLPESVQHGEATADGARLSLSVTTRPREVSHGSQPANEQRLAEHRRIVSALEACNGNQTRAAEQLQMPRRTLVAKLSAYGIPRPRKPTPPPTS